MASPRDLYYVAIKAFLEKDGSLFIFQDRFGDWDLPGGRIQRHEFKKPLERILARKIREELGSSVRYTLRDPFVFMRHQRREKTRGNRAVRIFAIGYRVAFQGGTVRLSRQHTRFLWVPRRTLRASQYFTGGWRAGVEEYLRHTRRKP